MQILGLLGMYFDAAMVFVKTSSLLLALVILLCFGIIFFPFRSKDLLSKKRLLIQVYLFFTL